MDIEVFCRHLKSCFHSGDRHWRRCHCPKWLYHKDTYKRESARTQSWERAETLAKRLADECAAGGKVEERHTIEEAVRLYLSDKHDQNSGDTLIGKLTRLLLARNPPAVKPAKPGEPPRIVVKPVKVSTLVSWCASKPPRAIKGVPLPVEYIADVTLRHLEEFRNKWPGSALTKKKKQELLRAFFSYCFNHGWVRTNPAKLLSRITVEDAPTDYFDPAEFSKILAACDTYRTKSQHPELRRQKVKALALLMRWSGLRAGDAIKLECSKLNGNKLLLRTEKTGTPMWCPIPPDVADQLRSVENSNPAYFFWSGNGSADSVYSDYHRTFEKVFAEAKLGKRCHPHMFRDTFAVELLLAGVPMEQISKLLGHKSIRVTEKHYSPWVRARQDQLEESVQKAWVVQ